MKNFYAKILLFGEYSILKSSAAVTIPCEHFSAKLQFATETPSKNEKLSNRSLLEFMRFLSENDFSWDLGKLKHDLQRGMFLNSSIPQAYGIGSSGAVVASLFNEYGKEQLKLSDVQQLRTELARAESFFHGQSSGIDPLSILMGKPLFISQNGIESLDSETLASSLRNFFLFDTQVVSNTGGLVAHFNQLFSDFNFKEKFDDFFLPLVNSLILDLVAAKNLNLKSKMNQLSAFQLDYFSGMIPDSFQSAWRKGLDTGDYFFKLCGSGGGGYLLVYSELERERLKNILNGPILPLKF